MRRVDTSHKKGLEEEEEKRFFEISYCDVEAMYMVRILLEELMFDGISSIFPASGEEVGVASCLPALFKSPMSTSDSSSSSSSSPSEDAQFKRWRKKISWMTGIGLTPQEQEIRKKEQDEKIEPLALRRCEKMKEDLMHRSM